MGLNLKYLFSCPSPQSSAPPLSGSLFHYLSLPFIIWSSHPSSPTHPSSPSHPLSPSHPSSPYHPSPSDLSSPLPPIIALPPIITLLSIIAPPTHHHPPIHHCPSHPSLPLPPIITLLPIITLPSIIILPQNVHLIWSNFPGLCPDGTHVLHDWSAAPVTSEYSLIPYISGPESVLLSLNQ